MEDSIQFLPFTNSQFKFSKLNSDFKLNFLGEQRNMINYISSD